jgi:hypothetical protein
MPSTVQRNSTKTGLVLLESRVSVGDDGLVTLEARFLAPVAGFSPALFSNDSPWPLVQAPLPLGLPSLQGGPYLNTYSVQKENGLTFIDAKFVSATNPVRVATSTATEKLNFSGFAESSTSGVLGTASATGALSFDYYTRSMTKTYTVIAPNTFAAPVQGEIGARFNVRREGLSSLVTTSEQEFVTESIEVLGLVSRVSRTARRIIVQGETPQIKLSPWLGATLNGTQLFNPWRTGNITG